MICHPLNKFSISRSPQINPLCSSGIEPDNIITAAAAGYPQQPSIATSRIMAAVHLYVLAACSLIIISMLGADLSAAQSTQGQSHPYYLLNNQPQ
jgi:hypothetical protein